MSDHQISAQPSDFKDRKTGLVVFGIVQILLGAFCLILIPLMVFGMIVSATMSQGAAAPPNIRMMVPSVLIYLVIATWFIWMGVGSILARRWARALVLVTSWIWMIGGLGGFIFMLVLMPDLYGQMTQSGEVPASVVVTMKYVTLGFMAVFYLLIPGVLILFYGSKHVKATCASRDPRVRWTDRCPLPVLALSLMFGVWTGSMLLMGCYNWATPFFGVILNGMAGAGVLLITALLSGYLAWGTYKLAMWAWWSAVLLTTVWALSAGMTFSRHSLLDFYAKMNFPAEQLKIIEQCGLPQNAATAWYVMLALAVFLGYLLFTRRYFAPAENPERTFAGDRGL